MMHGQKNIKLLCVMYLGVEVSGGGARGGAVG